MHWKKKKSLNTSIVGKDLGHNDILQFTRLDLLQIEIIFTKTFDSSEITSCNYFKHHLHVSFLLYSKTALTRSLVTLIKNVRRGLWTLPGAMATFPAQNLTMEKINIGSQRTSCLLCLYWSNFQYMKKTTIWLSGFRSAHIGVSVVAVTDVGMNTRWVVGVVCYANEPF